MWCREVSRGVARYRSSITTSEEASTKGKMTRGCGAVRRVDGAISIVEEDRLALHEFFFAEMRETGRDRRRRLLRPRRGSLATRAWRVEVVDASVIAHRSIAGRSL